ncbi:MAG: site-2 protease family protein [Actinomycetota bacterium]
MSVEPCEPAPAGSKSHRKPPTGTGEDFLSPGFTFLKVRGISIKAHWTWVFVFALISWSLAGQIFPHSYPGLSRPQYLVMGITAAVIFFACVVLHELGHAFRALKEGMKVGDISLWLFGGVARFEGMFPSAGAEFRIAIAGPIVSVVLAAAFGAVALAGNAAGLPETVVGVASYLGRINAILVLFNMVPALPLDGGRVLRSWLWHRQGSFTAATLSAAKGGRGFAYALIGLGLLGFFTQAAVGGIWFVFLGWFILQAVQAEVSFALVRSAFSDVTAGQLMTPHPVTVPPEITIDEFFERARLRPYSAYPVVEQGSLIGLMMARAAGEVDASRRTAVRISEVMIPAAQTPVVTGTTPMMEALAVLRSGPGRALVMDDGRVSGIISVSDIAKSLELQQARGFDVKPEVRRAARPVWLIVGLAMFIAVASIYRPPIAVLAPTRAIDISGDVQIEGIETQKPNGKYLMVAVNVQQPSALMTAVAFFQPGKEVVPLSSVVPKGEEKDFARRQRQIFRESQELAAAAAAQAGGRKVEISGKGAEVLSVLRGGPAGDKLKAGDVITAVDGTPVEVSSDLREVTTRRPPATSFDLEVRRGQSTRSVEVISRRLRSTEESSVGIGVLVETVDLEVDLPFEVKFRRRDIGGPSAGLVYALAIADMIDSGDYARGRSIAASGTISLDGEVGDVGGLQQKAIGAKSTGASMLLVPRGELEAAGTPGIKVQGVASLDQAIKALAA